MKPKTKSPASVDAFVAGLRHPLKADLLRVRAALLAVAPEVREEVKWNSVSFRTERDFFATLFLRTQDQVQLVLFTGVAPKATAKTGVPVKDPARLIERWAAKDRCLLSLGSGATLTANLGPLTSLVRAWLRFG